MKTFKKPSLTVVKFSSEDVIVTSVPVCTLHTCWDCGNIPEFGCPPYDCIMVTCPTYTKSN